MNYLTNLWYKGYLMPLRYYWVEIDNNIIIAKSTDDGEKLGFPFTEKTFSPKDSEVKNIKILECIPTYQKPVKKNFNRYNFRAKVVLNYYNDNGMEETIRFTVYNAIPKKDGTVDVHKDDLYYSLYQLNYTDKQIDLVLEHLHYIDNDWYNITPKTCEQCTGILDNNQKLIYEGDNVRFKTPETVGFLNGVIKWDEDEGRFSIEDNYQCKSAIYGNRVEVV